MWGRAAAGIGPGFLLAASLSGLACWLLPGPWQEALVPATIAFFPLWIATFCVCFAFRNGRRAWACMLPLELLGLGVLRGLQSAGWVK